MATDKQKKEWEIAENTSFDLEHRVVFIQYSSSKTKLNFEWF